jgi:hypothetical protein
MKRKSRRKKEKEENRGLVGHHIYYKESARTVRGLKFAKQRFFVLLMEVG